MTGQKTFSTVHEFALSLEVCDCEVQITDEDGDQWISLLIDGCVYNLSAGDATNIRNGLGIALVNLI